MARRYISNQVMWPTSLVANDIKLRISIPIKFQITALPWESEKLRNRFSEYAPRGHAGVETANP